MSVLGYHNIMKMSNSVEVMIEIRVLIFVSHEGLPTDPNLCENEMKENIYIQMHRYIWKSTQ